MKRAYDASTADGQKRLMADSVGLPTETYITRRIDTSHAADYGADPIGDGTFRMVPSGNIVDYAERCRRLKQAA